MKAAATVSAERISELLYRFNLSTAALEKSKRLAGYERRSTLITSNLVFSEWERIFKDPMATAAAIDRLVHHATILEFNVPSYRTRRRRRTDAGQAIETVDAKTD